MFKKMEKYLSDIFGQVPRRMYFDGDIKQIRLHYEYRKKENLDQFLIDDTTWNDLFMDDVFKRINLRTSTPGEQYLYYILRSPSINENQLNERTQIIDYLEKNQIERLKLHKLFTKLGRARGIDLHSEFNLDLNNQNLYLYVLLSMGFLFAPIIGFLIIPSQSWLLLYFILGAINIFTHILTKKQFEYEIQKVNYLLRIIQTTKKIKKQKFVEEIPGYSRLNKALESLQTINIMAFSIENESGESITNEFSHLITYLINKLLFVDLIGFMMVRKKIKKSQNEIFTIYEEIGKLDAGISIASYRASIDNFTTPTIDFHSEIPYLKIEDVAHPLLENPVLNSINTEKSVLLTGSNASGKSTFLRSVTVNVILAQTIGTVLAKNYEAPAFYIYTSMAITDNLLTGDSYFIAEIKSMKRIVDAIKSQKPVFCVIDEILRGTNTIERICASSELLLHMTTENALVFAATHDMELCPILQKDYSLQHFTEYITDGGEVKFDYFLRTGPTRTRNAIKLLGALGSDDKLINAANNRASRYNESGKWS